MKLDLTAMTFLGFTIFVAIGTIASVIKFAPAFIHAYQGNIANATDIVVDVFTEKIFSSVCWTIILMFISSFFAILGIKLKT